MFRKWTVLGLCTSVIGLSLTIMGIYGSAIIIALIIVAVAVAFALIPEILHRLPRRRMRHEEHLLKPNQEEGSPRRRRPDLKREPAPDADAPPARDPE